MYVYIHIQAWKDCPNGKNVQCIGAGVPKRLDWN